MIRLISPWMDFCRLGASSMERETGVQPVGRTSGNTDNAGQDDQPLAFGLYEVHSVNFYKSRPCVPGLAPAFWENRPKLPLVLGV